MGIIRSREQIVELLRKLDAYDGTVAGFCREHGLDSRRLRAWRQRLDDPSWKNGQLSPTPYSGAEKQAAVRALAHFPTVAAAARGLGIDKELLHRWRIAARERGLASLQDGNLKKHMKKTKVEKPESAARTGGDRTKAELLREIELLRTEVACLKKLKALTSKPAATTKNR
jgi:transposase